MELLVYVLYDAIAVVILLMSISKTARVGFAQTITALVGRIAAFFGAMFIGKSGSRLIYDLFLGRRMEDFLEESIAGSTNIGDIVSSLQEAVDALPDFVANFYGLSSHIDLEGALDTSIADVVSVLEEQLVEPAVTGFIHIILFLISFTVLCFLANHFAKAVGLVFKLPIIKTVDRFFGGLLGILQGGINLYLIALVVRFILYFVSDPPALLSESVIDETIIWSRIFYYNPFDFLK